MSHRAHPAAIGRPIDRPGHVRLNSVNADPFDWSLLRVSSKAVHLEFARRPHALRTGRNPGTFYGRAPSSLLEVPPGAKTL